MHGFRDASIEYRKWSKSVELLLLLTIISCLFLPSVRVASSLSLRLDDLTVLVVFPLVYMPILIVRTSEILVSKYLKVYAFLYTFIVFSCIRGYLMLGVPFDGGDINELIRLLKPLFLIMMVSYVDVFSFERKFKQIIKWGSVFIISVGFIQYFNVFGLGSLFLRLYGEEHHVENFLNSQTSRIILTGGGPNDGAIIALLLFIFNLFLFLKKRNYVNLVLAIGLILCILLTSSRTALVAMVFVLVITLLKHGSFLIKCAFVLLGVGVFVYILPKFIYIYEGFRVAYEGNSTSVLHRFEKWNEALDLFYQSPLFGWGLAKAIHSTIVDGEFFLILRRFGILGFGLVMIFIHYPLFSKNKTNDYFILSVKYLALSSLVIMITNNFFNSYQVITAYVALVALSRKLNK